MYDRRIRNEGLLGKVTSPYEASLLIKDGMTVATSGFTPSGYPKAVPQALANRVKDTGEPMEISLITGASVGNELDGAWAKAGIIGKRLPYQTQEDCRNGINSGRIKYIDMHLSHVSQYINYGFLGKIDVALVEAVAITEDGHLIPSTSVGITPMNPVRRKLGLSSKGVPILTTKIDYTIILKGHKAIKNLIYQYY